MIRDRLKKVVKKVALRAFNMEWDAEETSMGHTPTHRETVIDESIIPKVVDGSGDTPGPNHKTDIGRTWIAAQLASGVAPYFLDIRPAAEVGGGLLPGAVLLPGAQVRTNLHRLPAKETRVTVYDQTGELGSEATAAWLREQGWTMARRLRGGFAEWIANGEPVEAPAQPAGAKHKVGDPVRLASGREGYVQEVTAEKGGVRYTIQVGPDEAVGPVGDDALAS
jgi:rhodanese-related sulfurtransferase